MTSKVSFANSPDLYQLMGSKFGQTLQTGVLFASTICLIKEIARTSLLGPTASISPVLHGTSVLLAWMGRNAVRELAKYQDVMRKAASREEMESQTIEGLKIQQKQTEDSLLLIQKEALKLQQEHVDLTRELANKEQDWNALKQLLKESELQILKIDAIFHEILQAVAVKQRATS